MNTKRFWWSVFAVWAVILVTDFLFHGIWLNPLYHETMQFWRSDEEMKSLMPFMWFGKIFFAWAFVWIYSHGINHSNQWWQAVRYALAILLVSKVPDYIGAWVVSPFPPELIWKWFFIATVQALLCAFVMTWTFKPIAWLAKHPH